MMRGTARHARTGQIGKGDKGVNHNLVVECQKLMTEKATKPSVNGMDPTGVTPQETFTTHPKKPKNGPLQHLLRPQRNDPQQRILRPRGSQRASRPQHTPYTTVNPSSVAIPTIWCRLLMIFRCHFSTQNRVAKHQCSMMSEVGR